jgi:hypothetical protein
MSIMQKKERFNISKWSKIYRKVYQVASESGSESRNMKLDCLKQQARDYLDKCGLVLEKAKFPYSKNNKLTWKYLENTKTNNPSKHVHDFSPTILNKNCIYNEMEGF